MKSYQLRTHRFILRMLTFYIELQEKGVLKDGE